jgi:hypothetical protein
VDETPDGVRLAKAKKFIYRNNEIADLDEGINVLDRSYPVIPAGRRHDPIFACLAYSWGRPAT